MDNKNEYTISEVAKMFYIKRDTLLYYDKIGLFSPEERKDNNYRLYSGEQLALLDTILNLRDLGLSIKSISEFTKDISIEAFIKLANEALGNTEEEIKKLKERKEVLNATKREILEAYSAKYGELEIRELNEALISLSDIGDYSSALPAFDKNYEDFMISYQVPWIEIAGLKTELDTIIERKDYSKESRLFSKSGKKKNAKFEKGLYAILFYKGLWSEARSWYLKMIDDVKTMGYIATGPCYEEFPIAHLVEENQDCFVTKISIKVEPFHKEEP